MAKRVKHTVVKQMDYAAVAQAGVDAQRQLDQLVAGYNANHHNPKLFKISAKVGWIKNSERLFKYIHDYKVVLSTYNPAHDHDVVDIYFHQKEDSKTVRDIINHEFFSKVYRDENRHPSDFTKLVHVERGPDHGRAV